MPIDPVVVLSAKLTQAECSLREARLKRDSQLTSRLLAMISLLNEELYRTVPTSALGAAELLRLAASSLGEPAATSYAKHLKDIASRLSDGLRDLPDLIWLRSMRPALTGGLCGSDGVVAAPLISLALKGAARPVVIFRAALPRINDDDGMDAQTGVRW